MVLDAEYWLCFTSYFYDENGVEIACEKEKFGPFDFDDVFSLFGKFNGGLICHELANKYVSKFYDRVSSHVRKCKLVVFISSDLVNVYEDLYDYDVVKFDPSLKEIDDDLPF